MDFRDINTFLPPFNGENSTIAMMLYFSIRTQLLTGQIAGVNLRKSQIDFTLVQWRNIIRVQDALTVRRNARGATRAVISVNVASNSYRVRRSGIIAVVKTRRTNNPAQGRTGPAPTVPFCVRHVVIAHHSFACTGNKWTMNLHSAVRNKDLP